MSDLTQYLVQCLATNPSNSSLRHRIQTDIESTKRQIRDRLLAFDIDFDRFGQQFGTICKLSTDLKTSEKRLNELIQSDLLAKIGEVSDVCHQTNDLYVRSQRVSAFIDMFGRMKDQMSSLDQSFAVDSYDSLAQQMTATSKLYRQLMAEIETNDDLKPMSKDLISFLDSLKTYLTLKREEMIYNYKTKKLFNSNVKAFRDEFNNENVFEFNLTKNMSTNEYQMFIKTFVGIDEKSVILSDLIKSLNLYFIKPILSQEIAELVTEDQNRIVAKFGKSQESPITTLTQFFDKLNKFISNDHQLETGRQLMQTLGDVWKDSLFRQIVKSYLNPLMPKNELEIKSFLSLVDSAEDFRKFLLEIGFIDDSDTDSPFIEFAVNINSHFCCRLCTDFLISAKTMICRDLHQTVLIGTDDKQAEESSKAFPLCRVSQSMVELKDLVKQILDLSDRCSADCSKALIETVDNLCELYIDISHIYHRKMISEFPQQNAIYHNNCMFFANFIQSFAETHKSVKSVKQFIPIVKELGSQLFLRQMQSQEKLMLDLVQNQQFSHCINELATEDSPSAYGDQLAKELRHVFSQCVVHLNFLRNALIDVLPEKVYFKAIGTIINSLFSEFINKIQTQNDISSSGASRLSREIDFLLKEIKAFLKTENPMRFVSKWSKLTEINFILNASLLDIVNRWADGRGILAADFTPQEVKNLIRALFQNTERRAQALNRITSY